MIKYYVSLINIYDIISFMTYFWANNPCCCFFFYARIATFRDSSSAQNQSITKNKQAQNKTMRLSHLSINWTKNKTKQKQNKTDHKYFLHGPHNKRPHWMNEKVFGVLVDSQNFVLLCMCLYHQSYNRDIGSLGFRWLIDNHSNWTFLENQLV